MPTLCDCERATLERACSCPGGGTGAYAGSASVHDILGGLLSAVAIEAPTEGEQATILEGLFPTLAQLLPQAMATLALVRRAATVPSGTRSPA